MKKSPYIFLILLVLTTISSAINAQEANPYLSAWDHLDLSGSKLPVLMPYNRIIDPAGEQIYFGSPNLENHALDCALSPDKKTLAIMGRYRVLFYDIESVAWFLNLFRGMKMVYRGLQTPIPELSGIGREENNMSCGAW